MVITDTEIRLSLTDPLQSSSPLPYRADRGKAAKWMVLPPDAVQLLETFGFVFLCFCWVFKLRTRAVSKTFNHSHPNLPVSRSQCKMCWGLMQASTGCSYKCLPKTAKKNQALTYTEGKTRVCSQFWSSDKGMAQRETWNRTQAFLLPRKTLQ